MLTVLETVGFANAIPSCLEALTRAGLTPLEALDAATWGARAWLGRPGIAEGESADLVVYQEDPRQDVRVLAAPHRIILRGRVV